MKIWSVACHPSLMERPEIILQVRCGRRGTVIDRLTVSSSSKMVAVALRVVLLVTSRYTSLSTKKIASAAKTHILLLKGSW